MLILEEDAFTDFFLKLLQTLLVGMGQNTRLLSKSTVHTVRSLSGAIVHDPGELSEDSEEEKTSQSLSCID